MDTVYTPSRQLSQALDYLHEMNVTIIRDLDDMQVADTAMHRASAAALVSIAQSLEQIAASLKPQSAQPAQPAERDLADMNANELADAYIAHQADFEQAQLYMSALFALVGQHEGIRLISVAIARTIPRPRPVHVQDNNLVNDWLNMNAGDNRS